MAGPGVPAGRSVPARVGHHRRRCHRCSRLLGVDAAAGRDDGPRPPARAAGRAAAAPSRSTRRACSVVSTAGGSSLRGVDDGRLEADPGRRSRAVQPRARIPARRTTARPGKRPRVERMRAALQRARARDGARRRHGAHGHGDAGPGERAASLGYVGGSGGGGALDEPGLPDPRDRVAALRAAAGHPARAGRPARRRVRGGGGHRATRTRATRSPGRGRLAGLSRRAASAAAARAFRRALELDPDRPGVRQNYGKLLREHGPARRIGEGAAPRRSRRPTRAIARARSSLAETLDPAAARPRRRLRSSAEALRTSRDDPARWPRAGGCSRAQGKLDEAAKSLEAAADDGPDARIELARV